MEWSGGDGSARAEHAAVIGTADVTDAIFLAAEKLGVDVRGGTSSSSSSYSAAAPAASSSMDLASTADGGGDGGNGLGFSFGFFGEATDDAHADADADKHLLKRQRTETAIHDDNGDAGGGDEVEDSPEPLVLFPHFGLVLQMANEFRRTL